MGHGIRYIRVRSSNLTLVRLARRQLVRFLSMVSVNDVRNVHSGTTMDIFFLFSFLPWGPIDHTFSAEDELIMNRMPS